MVVRFEVMRAEEDMQVRCCNCWIWIVAENGRRCWSLIKKAERGDEGNQVGDSRGVSGVVTRSGF